MSALTVFFPNILQEFLAKAIRQEKEIKGTHVGKEETISICRSDFVYKYLNRVRPWIQSTVLEKKKTSKNSTKKLLILTHKFIEFVDIRSMHKNQIYFHILAMNNQKMK
jgi:hypothetical protein